MGLRRAVTAAIAPHLSGTCTQPQPCPYCDVENGRVDAVLALIAERYGPPGAVAAERHRP